ncbi:MAG: carbohydrate kinase [Phycisphaeraceae bacterium]|nr:carbohydrate kinase [Phycisphaeraceae bacterium]
MSNPQFTLVSIGEALFDVFADHRQLGGAPLNLALCADQLLGPHGGQAVIVSRIGQDAPGNEMLDALRQRGLCVDYLQSDPDRPTGSVLVDLDAGGQPTFNILPGGAWDVIQFDPDLESLARRADAVAFGTLAQRDAQSRNTIYRLLDAARRAVRLFDVNLRQDDIDRRVIQRSCESASIVKLNEQELPRIINLLGLDGEGDDAAEVLRKRFKLEMVALTRGARGTRLFTSAGIVDGAAASYPPAQGADAVGAGDACAAGLLAARLLRRPKQQIADLANRCGAFVASQPGGTPQLPQTLIESV